jgi:tetratricopeptide (TPR) repeat protein
MREEYQVSRGLYQESLVLFNELNIPFNSMTCLFHLAEISKAQRDYSEAKRLSQNALKIASQLMAIDWILKSVLEVISVWTKEGKEELIIEIATFLKHHPKSNNEVQENASKLAVEIEGKLSSNLVTAAQERGKVRTLESIVNEILAEDPETLSAP